MNIHLFEKLQNDGLVSPTSTEKVRLISANKLFSLHWELKTILYLGVLLLSGGLGILIYKNIDTIGHQAILALIALISAGCFAYCYRKKLPFSWNKVLAPNGFFDYVLLLGCLTFLTFLAYLQVQYNVFGTRYGAATFIPMLVLLFCAYFFDHLGILSMAITNFAAWLGLTVTPLQLFQSNDFFVTGRLINTGVFIGALLVFIAYMGDRKNLKKHFAFTYSNFGVHIFMIACLAGLMGDGFGNRYGDENGYGYLGWFLLMAAVTVFCYMQAMKKRSFYFLLIVALYGYIGLSYMVVRGLVAIDSMGAFYLGMLYFIVSGIGAVVFLVNINKRIKKA
ncbi:Predicted membrane protein [Chitinophaga sp. CF118]|uniref:DUF2157 domain-containing protein n=1 Tax=Chitinophaga sp. CF118 TaxID=1884367 RepID=UPI0008E0B28A|nr:DUF2157 domain-containing protein [Chitinophaga sp. CF118]SFE41638.1 Predicted membrane protein [Chitinophaga sp. CF118]